MNWKLKGHTQSGPDPRNCSILLPLSDDKLEFLPAILSGILKVIQSMIFWFWRNLENLQISFPPCLCFVRQSYWSPSDRLLLVEKSLLVYFFLDNTVLLS
jgi:hypothetical protein